MCMKRSAERLRPTQTLTRATAAKSNAHQSDSENKSVLERWCNTCFILRDSHKPIQLIRIHVQWTQLVEINVQLTGSFLNDSANHHAISQSSSAMGLNCYCWQRFSSEAEAVVEVYESAELQQPHPYRRKHPKPAPPQTDGSHMAKQ